MTSTKAFSFVKSAEVTRRVLSKFKSTELMNLCTVLFTATIAKPGLQNIDLNEA